MPDEVVVDPDSRVVLVQKPKGIGRDLEPKSCVDTIADVGDGVVTTANITPRDNHGRTKSVADLVALHDRAEAFAYLACHRESLDSDTSVGESIDQVVLDLKPDTSTKLGQDDWPCHVVGFAVCDRDILARSRA